MKEFQYVYSDDNTDLFICDFFKPDITNNLVNSKRDGILASPNPKRYKGRTNIMYMLTWSIEELMKLQEKEKWIHLYEKYGSVPRYLINDDKDKPQDKFESEYSLLYKTSKSSKGRFVVDNFCIFGKLYGEQQDREDERKNHMLVHLNPITDKNGMVTNYFKFTEIFASNFIMDQLIEEYNAIFYNRAAELLNSGLVDEFKKFDLNKPFEQMFTRISPPLPGQPYSLELLPPRKSIKKIKSMKNDDTMVENNNNSMENDDNSIENEDNMLENDDKSKV